MAFGSYLSRMHRILGRSNKVTQFAVRVRNQANAIVSAHLSGIESPTANGEYALVDLVAPKALNFVDVGGNIGNWSSRFIARMAQHPTGLIVEANSQCSAALRSRFKEYAAVTILDAALSDYSGTSTFFEGEGPTSVLSSLTPVAMDASSMIARSVSVSTLDIEIAKLGWKNISMLKIDAEGHDYFVLRGARRLLSEKLVDFVQFECNSTWGSMGVNIVAAVNYLTSLGYQVFQLLPNGLRVIDVEFYGSCGSANWVALHERSPDIGLDIFR